MVYIFSLLIVGFFVLAVLALKKGFSTLEIAGMCISSTKDAATLLVILVVIGATTGIWRVSGTIVTFVYYGVQIITPQLFLLIAFLVMCAMSYALGTAFGVIGTAGVVLISIARSGMVDPLIAGGAIMSGAFFGDRCSPISGTANMIAEMTGTDIHQNLKNMAKTGALPFILCIVVYLLLSFRNPLSKVNPEITEMFSSNFHISWIEFIPAAIIILLPLMKVSVMKTMAASIVSGAVIALILQESNAREIVKVSLLGYRAADERLGAILNGGGVISMMSSVAVVMISFSYMGLFKELGIVERLSKGIDKMADRIGMIPGLIVISLCSTAIFCNQIVAIAMCGFMKDSYEKKGYSKGRFAIDIENVAITVPTFVPWAIICTVPCSLLGVTYPVMLWSIYLYAVPLINWVTPRLTKGM